MALSIKCPDKNNALWKDLEESFGEVRAYVAFFRNGSEFPTVQRAGELLGVKPKAVAAPKPTMMNRPPPGGWKASDTVPKPNEPANVKAIRDEIKKLRQGLPVAEDMAMNDKGASLARLQAKIDEAEERLANAIKAAALVSGGRGGTIPTTPKPAEKWKLLGFNAVGNQVFEDANGVRSYVEKGIRITEPVSLIPTRGGIVTSGPAEHRAEFQVKAQVVSVGAPPEKPAPAGIPQSVVNEGDWIHYTDSYGKEHDGRVSKVMTTAGFVPGSRGAGRIKITFMVEDANGNAMISPKEGTPVTKIEPPATKPPVPETVSPKSETVQPPAATKTEIKSPIKNLSKEKQAEMAELRRAMMRKLGGMPEGGATPLTSGPPFDPEILDIGAKMVKLYVEGGVKTFEQFAQSVKEDMPSIWDRIKAHLRGIWNYVAELLGLDEVSKADADTVFTNIERTHETTTTEPKTPAVAGGERPVGDKPLGVAAGLPAGLPAGSGAGSAAAVEATGGVGGVGPADTGAVPAGGKRARTGRGGRAGTALPAGSDTAAGPVSDGGSGVPAGAAQTGDVDVNPEDNLRIQPDEQLVPATRSARINANLKAISLSRRLTEENRLPTPAEKRVLMQYSGWGDTFQAFGMTQIGRMLASDVYDEIKDGHQLYNILYNTPDQDKYNRWLKEYGNAYEQLKGILTPEEWESAKKSSLNAHFTSRTGIEGIWKIAEQLGFKGGVAVEPSAGIGNIIGLTPASVAGRTHWIGVELDNTTAQMLKQLYPKSDIQNSGFEDSKRTENNTADLVISNFPFGDYDVVDPQHPDYDGWSIHNYFLARSVDLLKPGGMVVAITSRYTLDGASGQKMRSMLANKADLIGAIRLPNDAFKKNAGTEVVTDVLVFRKKAGIGGVQGQRFMSLAPVDVPKEMREPKGKDEEQKDYDERINKPVFVNEYFVEHPENVLGTHSMKGTMYGGDSYTLVPKSGEDLAAQLGAVISSFPKDIMGSDEAAAEAAEQAAEVQTVEGEKPGRYIEKDGKVWQVDNQGRLIAPDFGKAPATIAAAKKLVALRDALTKQIDLEISDTAKDEDIENHRKHLNKLYDSFVAMRGPINDRKNDFMEDDPEFPLLASLEDEKRSPMVLEVKGKKITKYHITYVKGPMLLKRVNFPRTEPTSADGLTDAVSISMNYRGGISPEYIGKLLNIPPEEAREKVITEQLAFDNPESGLLEAPDLYLSGFVKKKLAAAELAAERDPKFNRNVEALRAVQPRPLPAEKIYFRLGSNWLPEALVERFMRDVLEIQCGVRFVRVADETRWIVSDPRRSSVANDSTFAAGGNQKAGLAPMKAHELVSDCLNLKLTEIIQTWRDDEGTHTIKYPEETAAARDMQDKIQAAFRSWVLKSPSDAGEVEGIYNRIFNGLARREYPVPKLDRFPGASNLVDLRFWQKRASVRNVQEGTLDAHGVGTGKTFTLITTAMEMRRLRTANKPLVVVQNSTLTQFANAFRRLYPTANTLVGNSKQTQAGKRKDFVSKIATRDWDAVIIPMSFFERIENDPEREMGYIQDQLNALEAAIREAEGANYSSKGRPKTSLGKQLVKVKTRFENKMKKVMARLAEKHDDLITFEKLGVDALLVDEAHAFKRGDFITKMERIKGLDTNGSDRSMDFYLKTQFIHQKSPDKNVILATGTPISNTLAEAWTMLRYVRPNLLKQFGVDTFDDFVGTFANTKATIEETPTGGFSQVLRLARYVNGPEIGEFWHAGADVYVLNRDDFKGLGINVPEVKGGTPTEVVIERPESVAHFTEFLKDWRLWWEHLDGKEKAELSYVPILQYGLARKCAIDLRLINPSQPDDPGSKLNRVVADVFKVWKDTADTTGTQLVFSNLYQSHDPKKRWLNEELHLPNPLYGKPVFNVFDEMKAKLVKMGVPESEMADFSKMNEAQRFATAEEVNSGKIRIAFGSTETLGTGLNLQDHGVVINHADPQFRPMDFEQRNGRFVRQGNQNKEVEIKVFGVKRTMDSTLYQLMMIKQKFIAQLMTADTMTREFEDPADESTLTFQDMAAAFSGNPLFAQRFGLENEIRQLSILQEDHDRKHSDVRGNLRSVQEGRNLYQDKTALLLISSEGLKKAFPEQAITSVTFKGKTATGDDAKKLLDEVFTGAYGEMDKNLQDEFASGDMRKSQAANLANLKKRGAGDDFMFSLTTRNRTRQVAINGLNFEIEFGVTPRITVGESGDLDLTNRFGKWKLLGYQSATWSSDKPWYVSSNDIAGHATTSAGLQTSLWNQIKNIEERVGEVGKAAAIFDKNEADLKRELGAPFEGENRLKEQTEKLAEVMKALEASGEAVGRQEPPGMTDIVAKYPEYAYLTRQIAADNAGELITQIQEEENAKAKSSFFSHNKDGFVVVKGAKPVKLAGFEWIDAFANQDKQEVWIISDGTSGARLMSGTTLAEAKSKLEQVLKEQGGEAIKAKMQVFTIANGLSPRAKAKDAALTAKNAEFQPGLYVKFNLGGGDEFGQIKEAMPLTAEIAIQRDGGGMTTVIPIRYATLLQGKELEDYTKSLPPSDEEPPEAKQSKVMASTAGTPMAESELQEIVNSIVPGAPNVTIINNPHLDFSGQITGNEIELNRAYIRTPQEAEDVIHEEMVHGVWGSPELRQETALLESMVTPEQLQDMADLGYPPHMLSEEAATDIFNDLRREFQAKSWFKQLLARIIEAVRRLFRARLTPEEAMRAILRRAVRAAREGRAEEATPNRRMESKVEPKATEQDGEIHQIGGRKFYTQYPEALKPDDRARGFAAVLKTVRELNIPGQEHERNIWTVQPDGFNYDAEGRKLIEALTNAIETQNMKGSDTAAIAPMMVRMVNYNLDAWAEIFSKPVANELRSISAGESSTAGQRLQMMQGETPDVLEKNIRNLNFNLQRTYAANYGGDAYESLFKRIAEELGGELTDDALRAIADNFPKQTELIQQILENNKADAGGRVFRAVQRFLSPRRRLKLSQMEKNVQVQEAANQIIKQMLDAGIEAPKPTKKTLSPLEKLLLMIKPEVVEKVTGMMMKAVREAELAAGRRYALDHVPAGERGEMEALFEAGEEPSDDDIEAGLEMPQYAGWKVVRDNFLNYSPVTKKLASKIVPTPAGLAREIMNTPGYMQPEMFAKFVDRLKDEMGLDDDQAKSVADALRETYFDTFDAARKKAWEKAIKSMTPEEKQAIPPSDTKLWNKIQRFFNAGGDDVGELLRQVAILRGETPPTVEEVAAMKQMLDRIQELSTLTPARQAEISEQLKGITDPEERKAKQTRLSKRVAEAANTARIAELQRNLGARYARIMKPFTRNPLRFLPPFAWINPTEAGRNTASAVYNFITANILAKIGFPIRLFAHVETQFLYSLLYRPPAVIWQVAEAAVKAGKPAEIWPSIHAAIKATGEQWMKSLGPAARAARAQLAGRGAARNVDGVFGSVNALERAQLAAEEYAKKGDYSRAAMFGFIALWRHATRVVGALDAMQGEQIEYQELRNQFMVEAAKAGWTRAQSELRWPEAFGDMKAEWAQALHDAREMAVEYGTDLSETALQEAADQLVKARFYNRIEMMGLPADSMQAYINRQRLAQAWQVAPGEYSVGWALYKGAQGWNKAAIHFNMPMLSMFFARAIANGVNYYGRATPLYPLFTGRTDKKTGVGSDPFSETPVDRKTIHVRAAMMALLGGLVAYLIFQKVLKVVSRYPVDKKEREKFIAEGHKPGTIEWQHDDGTFTPFSLTVGPFVHVGTYAVAAGAIVNLADQRAAQQKRADDEADKKGLAHSTIEHDDIADALSVAGQAAWQTLLGSATATGLTSGFSEFGVPNAKKTAASLISPMVPGLPFYQEVSRMMGVSLDKNLASVFDYMMPLPSSGARMVNVLGDPVKTPNDAQRIIQSLTGGNYPGIVDPGAEEKGEDSASNAAYQALFATGYKVPAINATKGYNFNGTFRPMSDDELVKFTAARGAALKVALAGLGSGATPKQVQTAVKDATNEALASVGAAPTASKAVSGVSGQRAAASGVRTGSARTARGRKIGVRKVSMLRSGRQAGGRRLGVRVPAGASSLRARRLPRTIGRRRIGGRMRMPSLRRRRLMPRV